MHAFVSIALIFVLAASAISPQAAQAQSLSLAVAENGNDVTVTLAMTDIPAGQYGYQTFLHFDPTKLAFDSGAYDHSAFAVELVTIAATSGGNIDLAAGVDVINGQGAAGGTATLAVLHFHKLSGHWRAHVDFRDNNPPTYFSDGDGNTYGVPQGLSLLSSPAILGPD